MALYEVTGTIIFMSQIESGISRNGYNWQRMAIVLQSSASNGTYRNICLKASGDKVDDVAAFNVSNRVKVTFAISAREWEGKWYNDIDIVSIEDADVATAPPVQAPAPSQASGNKEEDLPF